MQDPVIGAASEIVVQQGHTGSIVCIAWTPDNKFMLTGSHDKTVKLWDVATGELVRTFVGNMRPVMSLAISPDRRFLATGAYDGLVNVWKLETGELLHSFPGKYIIHGLAFTNEAKFLLVADEQERAIRYFDLSTGKVEQRFGGTSAALLSKDQKSLFTSGYLNPIRWDFESGKKVHTFDAVVKRPSARLKSLALSQDGTMLAAGTTDNAVIVWNATTNERFRVLEGLGGPIESVDLSAAGTLLAARAKNESHDPEIVVWEVESGKQRRLYERNGDGVSRLATIAMCLDLSDDGKQMLVGYSDGSTLLWDAATGKILQTFPAVKSASNHETKSDGGLGS